jgi:hypothetical protein
MIAESSIADLMAAGVFKDTVTILNNIATSPVVLPADFPRFYQPTPEQLIYAKVKLKLKPGERRKLPIKWGRWKAADAVIRERQGKLKRLPNGMKKEVFEEVRKSLEGGPFHGGADMIRKDYYLIHGIIRKLDPTSK